MGINIGVTSNVEFWDCVRHVGDKEVINCAELEWEYRPESDAEDVIKRPKDLEKAMAWVRESGKIPEGNQARLLRILEHMKSHFEVWFDVSY